MSFARKIERAQLKRQKDKMPRAAKRYIARTSLNIAFKGVPKNGKR